MADSFDVTIPDWGAMFPQKQATSTTDPRLTRLMKRLTKAFNKAVLQYTPVKQNPERGSYPQGMLKRSLHVTFDESTNTIYASYDASFAVYVLSGVSPQYMKWLLGSHVSFVAKSGDHVSTFVRFVGISNGKQHWFHPGTPAKNPYLDAWNDPSVMEIVAEMAKLGALCSIGFGFTPVYTGPTSTTP